MVVTGRAGVMLLGQAWSVRDSPLWGVFGCY